MKNIDPQIRNILKCNFVEKLIISNHNPDVRIEDLVKIDDKRIIFINQDTRRGCGHRWEIANKFEPEYLIVIDDDIFLFPSQLKKLFINLVSEPDILHGFTGMVDRKKGHFEYVEGQNKNVDFLCEVYALTKNHLRRYMDLKILVAKNDEIARIIESAMDFMVVSQTGSQRPKIHGAGRIFRSSTFKEVGVAVHKEENFTESMIEISQALKNVGMLEDGQPYRDIGN